MGLHSNGHGRRLVGRFHGLNRMPTNHQDVAATHGLTRSYDRSRYDRFHGIRSTRFQASLCATGFRSLPPPLLATQPGVRRVDWRAGPGYYGHGGLCVRHPCRSGISYDFALSLTHVDTSEFHRWNRVEPKTSCDPTFRQIDCFLDRLSCAAPPKTTAAPENPEARTSVSWHHAKPLPRKRQGHITRD
jgi:hypothetical protein